MVVVEHAGARLRMHADLRGGNPIPSRVARAHDHRAGHVRGEEDLQELAQDPRGLDLDRRRGRSTAGLPASNDVHKSLGDVRDVDREVRLNAGEPVEDEHDRLAAGILAGAAVLSKHALAELRADVVLAGRDCARAYFSTSAFDSSPLGSKDIRKKNM